MSAVVTVKFVVGLGYVEGDYAMLHGNGGSGDIDWETPLSQQRYDLFPNRGGIFGFGHAPFGHFRFGHAHSMRTRGFGHLPFGHFPFGHGAVQISAEHKVTCCGGYKFGFACYDAAGNQHTGRPRQVTIDVHIAAEKPAGLKIRNLAAFVGLFSLSSIIVIARHLPLIAVVVKVGRRKNRAESTRKLQIQMSFVQTPFRPYLSAGGSTTIRKP
jgi:hypothetical protein